VTLAVLPDHPVPIASGKHTRVPVPVAVRKQGLAPDRVISFDETACRSGALGAMAKGDFMTLLFGPPRPPA
jgi:2,3-bisphosphoglycerate-independent phosphoglycerate mutase